MLFRTLFTTLALAATAAAAAPPSSRGRTPMAIVPVTKPASLLGSHYQVREPKIDGNTPPANVERLVPRAMPFPRYLAQRDQYEDDYVSNVGPPPPPQVPPPPAYPEFPPPPPSTPSSSASGSTATHATTHSHKKGEEKHKEKDQEQEKKRVRVKGKASDDVKGKSSRVL